MIELLVGGAGRVVADAVSRPAALNAPPVFRLRDSQQSCAGILLTCPEVSAFPPVTSGPIGGQATVAEFAGNHAGRPAKQDQLAVTRSY